MVKVKKLKRADCESIASLFVDDLIAYHKAGGCLKNLTAKKVYKKLRKENENGDEFSVEDVYSEIAELKERIAGLNLDNPNNEELVDLNLDISLTEEDHRYLLEKLELDAEADWTYEQQLAYIDEAFKLKTIREGDKIKYLKLTKHNSEEEIDVDELFKDKN